MTDTDAYPDTAYRGEPSAPPAPGEAPAETSRVEAKLRQYYLLRQGPQCGEYFALYEWVERGQAHVQPGRAHQRLLGGAQGLEGQTHHP
jgi:hypothetical protein